MGMGDSENVWSGCEQWNQQTQKTIIIETWMPPSPPRTTPIYIILSPDVYSLYVYTELNCEHRHALFYNFSSYFSHPVAPHFSLFLFCFSLCNRKFCFLTILFLPFIHFIYIFATFDPFENVKIWVMWCCSRSRFCYFMCMPVCFVLLIHLLTKMSEIFINETYRVYVRVCAAFIIR